MPLAKADSIFPGSFCLGTCLIFSRTKAPRALPPFSPRLPPESITQSQNSHPRSSINLDMGVAKIAPLQPFPGVLWGAENIDPESEAAEVDFVQLTCTFTSTHTLPPHLPTTASLCCLLPATLAHVHAHARVHVRIQALNRKETLYRLPAIATPRRLSTGRTLADGDNNKGLPVNTVYRFDIA